ncbi:hypothetical protein AAEX28_09435 [Lentisphaerota bacterium WC36G]|nr:hypothetical protein LJT99_12275 [Lentisphaerae bacterium WC36]
MTKRLEAIGVVILIIIGLIWGGFEIWLRYYADGEKLYRKSQTYSQPYENFKAKLYLKLAARKNHKTAIFSLVDLYKSQKNYENVIYYSKKGLKNTTRKGYYISTIAETYSILNNVEEAKKWYEKSIKLDKAKAFRSIGDLYVKKKDLPIAIHWYKKATEIDFSFNYYSLFYLLELTNNKDEIEKITINYLKSNDHNVINSLGDYYSNRNPDFAIEIYKKIAKNNLNTARSMAETYFKQKKYDLAQSYFDKALKIADDNYTYRCYANFLLEIGKKDKAFENIIKSFPTDLMMLDIHQLRNFVDIAVETSNTFQAEKKLKDLLKQLKENDIDFNNTEILFTLYYLYDKQNKTEKMTQVFQKFCNDYGAQVAYSTIGLYYCQVTGDFDKALKMYLKAPHNNNFDKDIASIYFVKKQYDLSLKHYLKVLKEMKKKKSYTFLHFEYESILRTIAEIYFEKGEYKQALKYALEAKANYGETTNLLRKIYLKLNP